MKKSRLTTSWMILMVIGPIMCYTQVTGDTKENYEWFDDYIGKANAQVFRGTAYVEKYRTINERHKFLKSSNFLPGSVVYAGQPYFGLELKYDLYDDQLLLNSKNDKGTVLVLNRDKIEKFIIDSRIFINSDLDNEGGTETSGFYEVLMETIFFTFLKKNRKEIQKNVGNGIVYYEFKSTSENFIFYKNSYHPLNKKRDFLRLFPEFKNITNSYYKTSRNTSDTDIFMNLLLMRIAQELSKPQSGLTE